MNGYGLGFWTLERIQKETGISNGELRQRNLALAKVERDILMDVPADGPPKHSDKVRATEMHHRVNRAVPASLVIKVQDSSGFRHWIDDIGKGVGRYEAVKAHFIGLEI